MYKTYKVKTSLDLVKDWHLPEFVLGKTWSLIICDNVPELVEATFGHSMAAHLAHLAVTEKKCFEIWVTFDKTDPGQVLVAPITREKAEKRIAELEAKRGDGNIEEIPDIFEMWKEWKDELTFEKAD